MPAPELAFRPISLKVKPLPSSLPLRATLDPAPPVGTPAQIAQASRRGGYTIPLHLIEAMIRATASWEEKT